MACIVQIVTILEIYSRKSMLSGGQALICSSTHEGNSSLNEEITLSQLAGSSTLLAMTHVCQIEGRLIVRVRNVRSLIMKGIDTHRKPLPIRGKVGYLSIFAETHFIISPSSGHKHVATSLCE